jgi:hypothetical protein
LPVPLDAGTYLTPEGFEPVMSIRLPSGWYGGASLDEFAVGQGLDQTKQTFGGGGLFVAPIAMPYAKAVATFGKLPGLADDREPTTGTLGGYEATTFYAHAQNGHVLLDPIAPGADIGSASAQQIFVDAGDTTILIRTEVIDDAARAEVDEVVASIAFPHAG